MRVTEKQVLGNIDPMASNTLKGIKKHQHSVLLASKARKFFKKHFKLKVVSTSEGVVFDIKPNSLIMRVFYKKLEPVIQMVLNSIITKLKLTGIKQVFE